MAGRRWVRAATGAVRSPGPLHAVPAVEGLQAQGLQEAVLC